jgi:hypothetical protein
MTDFLKHCNKPLSSVRSWEFLYHVERYCLENNYGKEQQLITGKKLYHPRSVM